MTRRKTISLQDMIEFYNDILRRDLDSRTRNVVAAQRDWATLQLRPQTAQAAE